MTSKNPHFASQTEFCGMLGQSFKILKTGTDPGKLAQSLFIGFIMFCVKCSHYCTISATICDVPAE
jgi:hypothetical protein